MFGFGNKSKSQEGADEAKQREIEEKKQTIKLFLVQLSSATPEDAERISEKMKLYCNDDKLLPFEYKKNALVKMRSLECDANMRVADALIRQAAALRTKEQLSERGKKLAESRRYFSKACMLGCESSWKGAYQRMAENIMLSGGVSLNTHSKAKPKSFAPVAPNRAKASSPDGEQLRTGCIADLLP